LALLDLGCINDAGQLAGSFNYGSGAPDHGFVYCGGSFTTIDVPGAFGTEVLGINDAGQIVGLFYDSSGNPGTGFVTTTPVPGAFQLFASGLGVMGWLARRKKRMAAVAS
jgi:hypothetical protein